jgi:site-specific DNA-methyltransferase (adenine-specific)
VIPLKVQEFVAKEERTKRFIAETLGDGIHTDIGTACPTIEVQDFGFHPELGHMCEVTVLGLDPDDYIPLQWIADQVAKAHGVVAKYKLPDPTEDEYRSLLESIRRFGVQHPIHLDFKGHIIDGRLRKRACDELGIPCPSVIVGKQLDQPGKQQLGLELDMCRKHVVIASKKALAKIRLREAPSESDRAIGGVAGLDHKTIATIRAEMELAGEIPHVEARHGKDGKRYRFSAVSCRSAREEKIGKSLLDELGDDAPPRQMELRSANRRLREIRKDRKSAEPPLEGNIQILHCDFRKMEIEPDSVDLIFSDPPYTEEFIPLYGDLSECAARWLKPGGLLMAYVGQYWLPECIQFLGKHLTYRWQCCLINKNCAMPNFDRGFFGGYRPILVYSKGTPPRPDDFVRDTFIGRGKNKELHEWQQSTDEAKYYIEMLTKPGDLILDCFGGSFTTGEAVYRIGGGRRFLGCDIDPQCVAIGRERLAKLMNNKTTFIKR